MRIGVALLLVVSYVAAQAAGPITDPTGMWRVGRTSLEFLDPERTMPGSSEPRRLMLRIWYPTDPPSPSAGKLPYMEGLDRAEGAVKDDELMLLRRVETHSTSSAAALPTSQRFPVLLFSHGEGTNAFLYSNLHEDLASRGYVVIGVDHPGAALYVAYSNGSVVLHSETESTEALSNRIAERAADLRFVRHRVRTLMIGGRLLEEVASEQVGVFGHSAGGIAAAMLCQQPPFADACVNMDGRLNAAPFAVGSGLSSPSRPFMYMTKPFRSLTGSELSAEGITREEATKTQSEAWARDGRLLASSGPPSYRATLHHAEHSSFSDEPLLLDPEDANALGLTKMVRDLLARFFDGTLADGQRSIIASMSDDDLEIEILALPTE